MFTWVMDAKSVITSPSPEKPILSKGLHQLRGLAWSGRGKIKRVDVSIDGGKNWKTAQLHSPVLSKSLTRFTLPFEWNGGFMTMKSKGFGAFHFCTSSQTNFTFDFSQFFAAHSNARLDASIA